MRVLIAEHNPVNLRQLHSVVADFFTANNLPLPDVRDCPTLSLVYEELSSSLIDAVITDWVWPPEMRPEEMESRSLGAKVADAAKRRTPAPLVVVVTRVEAAAQEARSDSNVDHVLTMDQLIQEPDLLSRTILGERDYSTSEEHPLSRSPFRRHVFIVHGHDLAALKALSKFIGALDLKPYRFVDARADLVKNTHQAGRIVTTYGVVDWATSRAAAVLCLLTPDELSFLSDDTAYAHPEHRARPNVIFEAGLAYAKKPTRTLLVRVGDTATWSDVDGVQYARFSDSQEDRLSIVQWLESMGLPVDRDYGDWQGTS